MVYYPGKENLSLSLTSVRGRHSQLQTLLAFLPHLRENIKHCATGQTVAKVKAQ